VDEILQQHHRGKVAYQVRQQSHNRDEDYAVMQVKALCGFEQRGSDSCLLGTSDDQE